jgi:Base plate wedge protein 53
MPSYSSASPYYKTSQTQGYLDVSTFRNISNQTDDIEFEISSRYQNRPDLLAYDLYSDSNLWWVFAVRNKSVIKDPIYDMQAGTKIFLPKLSTLRTELGI